MSLDLGKELEPETPKPDRKKIWLDETTGKLLQKDDAGVVSDFKGDQGEPGIDGVGLPAGGNAGDVLRKKTGTDYDTEFVLPTPSIVGLDDVDNFSVFDLFDDLKDPTGFVDPDNTVQTYDYLARTVTTEHPSGTIEIRFNGRLFALPSPFVSDPHPNVVGPWFLYFQAAGESIQPAWSQTLWDFRLHAPIAFVRRNSNASESYALRECHGLMDHETHEELHDQVGTYVKSGCLIDETSFTLNGTTDAQNKPGFLGGVIKDEDLKTIISDLAGGSYTIGYRTGSVGSVLWQFSNPFPFLTAGTFIAYNQLIGGSWQLTACPEDQYINYFVFSAPMTADAESQRRRWFILPGQNVYSSASAAQAEFPPNVDFSVLQNESPEYVCRLRITFLRNASGTGALTTTGRCNIAATSTITGSRSGQSSVSTSSSVGIPAGGVAGAVLAKVTANSFDTAWFPRPKSREVLTGAGTWTKPDGAKFLMIICQGAGGGGGGGYGNAAGTSAYGGGGGCGGCSTSRVMFADEVTATVAYSCGVGGSGGTGGTSAGTPAGTAGSRGGSTSFDTYLFASGGDGGNGGGVGSALGATNAASYTHGSTPATDAGNGGNGAQNGLGIAGANATSGGGGAGGSGGNNAGSRGGAGRAYQLAAPTSVGQRGLGGLAGAAGGGDAPAITATYANICFGGGSGGGYGATSATNQRGGHGANGYFGGAGGAGGGCGTNNGGGVATGGNGGSGGDGFIEIFVW